MSNPDQLEQDVNTTQQSLSRDIGRLNERVSPARAMKKRSDRLKSGGAAIKDRVMGSANDAGQQAGDKAGDALGSVRDATKEAAARIGDAATVDNLRSQTTGNPIAAGVVAFGLGWLLSSLVPASETEREATRKVEDNAAPLVDPLKQSAQEAARNLQQPVQQAADSLKQTASEATDRTAEHAQSAAADVQGHASSAAQDVKQNARSAADDASTAANRAGR